MIRIAADLPVFSDFCGAHQSLDKESAVREVLANITDEQVARILKDAVEPKALLNTVVDKITLDPDTHECQIHYQLPIVAVCGVPKAFR